MKEKTLSRDGIWICGVNPVREALLSNNLVPGEMVHSRIDARIQDLLDLCTSRGIPVRMQKKEALSAFLGHAHHQGVALLVPDFPYVPLENILKSEASRREPLVVLDSVQDPQNLGALMRSACFLGAKGLVIPRDRSAKVTGSVMKVAAGAASYLPVIQVTNLARCLDGMKEAGLWVVGLAVEEALPIYDVDLTVPLGVVIGNEMKGLRPLVRKHCDILAAIPSHGPMESLNAAVAGAVVLAEIQRQRGFSRKESSPQKEPSQCEPE